MPQTFFRDFVRDNGDLITVEYRMEGETCACIIDAWSRTNEYNNLWIMKNAIESCAYGNRRHTLSFDDEERERLDEINRAIERAKFELTTVERERMEGWLSETHVQTSDIEF